MIRISVLVKVNCILVKIIGIQHYSFIDLIVPCFFHISLYNTLSNVMVSVFDLYMVDIELYPRSGLTKYQKRGICCFSIKHVPLRGKGKTNFQQYFSYIVVVSFIGGDTGVPGKILCVLEISILSINKIFRLAFGNVPRVW
jgi:hypothetical protein